MCYRVVFPVPPSLYILFCEFVWGPWALGFSVLVLLSLHPPSSPCRLRRLPLLVLASRARCRCWDVWVLGFWVLGGPAGWLGALGPLLRISVLFPRIIVLHRIRLIYLFLFVYPSYATLFASVKKNDAERNKCKNTDVK